MSRLYASLDADASKTIATRRGHRRIVGHLRGWDLGVRVEAFIDGEGRDAFSIYRTGGSNGGAVDELIAMVVGDVVLYDPPMAVMSS